MKLALRITVLMLCVCGGLLASGVDADVKAAFKTARSERVAVVALGDSNQRFGGTGWSHFFARNLMTVYGGYAAPLRSFPARGKIERSPLPAAFKKQCYSGWHLPVGKSVKSSWQVGSLLIKKDDPLDVTGPLAFHLQVGSFSELGGSFCPALRRNEAPWTLLRKMAEAKSTQGEPDSLAWVTYKVPANPKRTMPLMFSAAPVNGRITGPFLGSLLACENTVKEKGIAYHTLYASGGQSLVDMLKWCQDRGPERLGNYFSGVDKLLHGKGKVIVKIHSGMNDRNEKLKSLGPAGGLTGSSPEAYYDNLKGLTEILTGAWLTAGGKAERLFFCFMPSHPVADPDDKNLTAYRIQAVTLAAEMGERAGVIQLNKIIPYQQMKQLQYFNNGRPSDAHLSTLGYDSISAAVVSEIAK